MNYFLIYIIKSTVCLTLFYLFFKVLLSRETFSRFNRFVLLAGMVVCAVLPMLEIKVSQAGVIQEPVTKIEGFFIMQKPSDAGINPDDILVTEPENEILNNTEYSKTINDISLSPLNTSIPTVSIIKITYGTGFFITLVSLLISVFRMVRLIRKGTRIERETYTIICIPEPISPFSWGRYIVLNENDYQQNPDEILTHEEVHVGKRHSLDLLFAEFFILFHWFNPVAWLLKGELQDIHEYEADKWVINQGIDATKYQLMLVKKAVGARSYAIANSFNHSKIKIKNRITMMLKEKSNRWARAKLLLFAPLAVVLLQAFARPETVRIHESPITDEITIITDKITIISEEMQEPEDMQEVQRQEKWSEKQKELSEKQKELSDLKKEGKVNAVDIKESNDSITKLNVKGTLIMIIGDKKITLDGDNIDVIVEPVQKNEIIHSMESSRNKEKNMLSYLQEEVEKNIDHSKLMPTALGVGSLTASLENYNRRILEKERLLVYTEEDAPVIKRVNERLTLMREEILSSIKGLINSYDFQ